MPYVYQADFLCDNCRAEIDVPTRREIADLVPRHAQAIRISELQAWPINPGWSSSVSGSLSAAAESYRARLIGAGVPLPASGSGTAEFWRDAAARGC